MKRFFQSVASVAKNPAFRPVEVWAVRAIFAYVAVKLGVDVKDLAQ